MKKKSVYGIFKSLTYICMCFMLILPTAAMWIANGMTYSDHEGVGFTALTDVCTDGTHKCNDFGTAGAVARVKTDTDEPMYTTIACTEVDGGLVLQMTDIPGALTEEATDYRTHVYVPLALDFEDIVEKGMSYVNVSYKFATTGGALDVIAYFQIHEWLEDEDRSRCMVSYEFPRTIDITDATTVEKTYSFNAAEMSKQASLAADSKEYFFIYKISLTGETIQADTLELDWDVDYDTQDKTDSQYSVYGGILCLFGCAMILFGIVATPGVNWLGDALRGGARRGRRAYNYGRKRYKNYRARGRSRGKKSYGLLVPFLVALGLMFAMPMVVVSAGTDADEADEGSDWSGYSSLVDIIVILCVFVFTFFMATTITRGRVTLIDYIIGLAVASICTYFAFVYNLSGCFNCVLYGKFNLVTAGSWLCVIGFFLIGIVGMVNSIKYKKAFVERY